MISLDQKTPGEILDGIAQRARHRRKDFGFTQAQMAQKAGMSLGSYKRFEQQHQISLESLVKLAIALDCEDDLERLFSQRAYRSIEEVIRDANNHRNGA